MRALPRAARAQRGAVSVMAAVALTMVIGAALLAVDLGSLFNTRRELQTVADTAALSAVNNLAAAQAIALDAAALNQFPVPGTQQNTLGTVLGHYDVDAREFTPGGSAAEYNAVQVTVTTQQPYFFMLGSRQVTASAVAMRNDIAALSVGTSLLDIDTEKSVLLNALLGKLLNTSLNLSAIAYQGLVNTSIRLLDLVKVVGSVGTVEELLKLDLTVGELLELSARALERSSILGLDATVVQTLDLLALRADGNLNLKLSDLINVDLAPGNQAAEAKINLMQLVTLAAQVANREHFIDIPVLGINLPGLVKLDAALTMIESPGIAIGPAGQDASGNWRTSVHTAQWRLKLDLLVGELLGGLVRLPLYLEIGAGEAWLKDIDCRYPRDASIVQVGAASSAVRAYVGNVNPDAMTNRSVAATVTPATILNVLGLVKATARLQVDLPGTSGDLEFTGPFDGSNTQRIHGLTTAGLGEILLSGMGAVLDVELLGIKLGLGEVVEALVTLLAPVFALLDSLIAPVLSLLGIQIGIADVTTFDLSCGAPQLVR